MKHINTFSSYFVIEMEKEEKDIMDEVGVISHQIKNTNHYRIHFNERSVRIKEQLNMKYYPLLKKFEDILLNLKITSKYKK